MPLFFFAFAVVAGSLILGNPGRKLFRRRWKVARHKRETAKDTSQAGAVLNDQAPARSGAAAALSKIGSGVMQRLKWKR
jgi:hypothetical protein